MTKPDYLNLSINEKINLRSGYQHSSRRFRLCVNLKNLTSFPDCSRPEAFQDYYVNKKKSEKFEVHF